MSVAPIDYAPRINPPEEFVGPPMDPEDERIEVGVVIVGGGPAGLACAIRLTQLLEEEPALAESLGEVPVALVEKGRKRVEGVGRDLLECVGGHGVLQWNGLSAVPSCPEEPDNPSGGHTALPSARRTPRRPSPGVPAICAGAKRSGR